MLVLLLAAAPLAAQTATVGARADSACSYDACALRLEPGFLGVRLVRGTEGEPIGVVGPFGTRLAPLVAASPRAVPFAQRYDRDRVKSVIVLVLGSAAFAGSHALTVRGDEGVRGIGGPLVLSAAAALLVAYG